MNTRCKPVKPVAGNIRTTVLFFLLLPVVFSACATGEDLQATGEYAFPTQGNEFAIIIPPTPTGEISSLEFNCTNNLVWQYDLTVPDSSIFFPGEEIDKQWLVQNTGDCNWNRNYRLRLISGPALGASPEQALYPARAGSLATIRILFTAPYETGMVQSVWQAYDPQGQPFGDLIFLEIRIQP